MGKLSDKVKEEGKELWEETKEEADEFGKDVVSFWKTDKKALAIFAVVCLVIGFIAGAIIL